MATIDERIIQARERAAQLERQKKLRDNKEKEKQKAIAKRRNEIVGEITLKSFPEFSKFQPRYTKKKNDIEFAELIYFMELLANDKEYINQLKEKVKQKISMENQ